MIEVGYFNEQQLLKKEDKKLVKRLTKENPSHCYPMSKIVRKKGKMLLHVWLLTFDESKNVAF